MSVIGASANRFNPGGLTETHLQQPLILRPLLQLQLRFRCIIMCVFFHLVMAVIIVCEDIGAKKKRKSIFSLVWGQLRLTELILSFLSTDQIWSIQKHTAFPLGEPRGLWFLSWERSFLDSPLDDWWSSIWTFTGIVPPGTQSMMESPEWNPTNVRWWTVWWLRLWMKNKGNS